MSIAKAAAIEAARAFVRARQCVPWDEDTLEAYSDEVDGRHTWVVKASDALPEGEDAWMHPVWQPVLYFVDRETGELFGFATERSKILFK